MELADRIGKTVAQKCYSYESIQFSVTLTIGVTVIKHNDSLDSIIKNADAGMYQVKRMGKNCVVFFNDAVTKEPSLI